MTELIEIAIGVLLSIVFALGEIAVTMYANDKTAERVMKHVDENTRRLEELIKEKDNLQ